MVLAEQLDPEKWHRILDRFFQILSDGVHRFEGTINQYTGDGIMALFGAPIAHEDHAQRACYAALALRDELRAYADELRRTEQLSFSVRMGINSGEVIVGKIGDDLRMDYTAQGQTVGLAQRMEQLAPGESVYMTEHTAQLVEGYFALRDLGEFDLKGSSDLLHVYDLEGVGTARTRLDVSRSRGLTKFVGRDDEMATLEAALKRALEGHGQVVGVVAEAGAGKSRLCFEFLERCRAKNLPINEARGVAHGSALPLHPIRELFRSYYGVSEQDTSGEARQKIAGQLLLIDDAFRDALPVIFDFLGVADPENPAPPMDPDARQRELRRVMRAVSQAYRGLQVTLLEDLHWFDEGSLEFLETLVEMAQGMGSLLLVNFRPGFHAGWMQKSGYQQLPLVPLGPQAIRALLADVLGTDPSVEALPEVITERTAGNPFFVEETIQSLIESGHLEGTKGAYRLTTSVDRLPLPRSVQAVLAARIDRLADREKLVLQTAAVIGKEFAEPLLAHVLERPDADRVAALDALKGGEFVYETALYPATEYAFKHPLTQEVAYDSQLTESRARVHAAVAKAIEIAHPEELDEQAALLAHHWEQAGDALQAARWNARAAQWSGVAGALQALRHWQRVRALLAAEAETPEASALCLRACLGILSFAWQIGVAPEDATAVFEEGRQRAERSGDRRSLANLHALYGAVRESRFNDNEGHLELARESVRLADETDHLETQLDALVGLVSALGSSRGRLAEALATADRALALVAGGRLGSTGLWLWNPALWIVNERARLLSWSGALDEARLDLERLDEQVQLAREIPLKMQILQNRAETAELRGDANGALEQARRMAEQSEWFAGTMWAPHAHAYLGRAHLLAGRIGEALEAFVQWEAATGDIGVGRSNFVLMHQPCMAQAHRRAGDLPRAHAIARQCAEETRAGKVGIHLAQADLELARVLLELEGPNSEGFQRALAEAERLLDESGAHAFQPFLREVQAHRAALMHDPDTQQRELREARRLFTAMGATGHAERLAQELEGLGA
jgi:class 3 adenylate cyclase/tetratricopeptide (TPR) repeat protein